MAKERPVALRHTRWHVDCPACLNAGRHEMFIIGPEVTFSEGAAQWIEGRKVKAPGTRSRYVSENTLWDYETYVRALNKMFAGTPLGEFKKPHIGLGLLREYHRLRSLGYDPDDAGGPRWAHPAGPNKINPFSPLFIGAHVSTAPLSCPFSASYNRRETAIFRNLSSCSKPH